MQTSVAILAASFALAALSACKQSRAAVGYAEPPEDGVVVTCPVSGQQCAKTAELSRAVVDAKTYYFCEEGAWQRFLEDPDRYRDSP